MFVNPARHFGSVVVVVSVQAVNCLKIQRDVLVLVASLLCWFKPEIDCVNPARCFFFFFFLVVLLLCWFKP